MSARHSATGTSHEHPEAMSPAGPFGVLLSCASYTWSDDLVQTTLPTREAAEQDLVGVKRHGLDGVVVTRHNGEWVADSGKTADTIICDYAAAFSSTPPLTMEEAAQITSSRSARLDT